MGVYINIDVKEIKRGAVAILNIDDVAFFVSGEAIIAVPDHGDLIDMDEFNRAMYHEAFEVDSPMQKWESGCWIRYKMFERLRDAAPVVIPAESEIDKWWERNETVNAERSEDEID